MEKDGLIAFEREEEKRKLYRITELGKEILNLEIKPVKSPISYMPAALYELPYEGAKEMLLVDEVDNKEFLTNLFNAMYEEL